MSEILFLQGRNNPENTGNGVSENLVISKEINFLQGDHKPMFFVGLIPLDGAHVHVSYLLQVFTT